MAADDMAGLEYRLVLRFTVIRHRMFDKGRQAGRDDRVDAGDTKEDVLGRFRFDREPAGVIERAGIDADRAGEAFETQPQPCAAIGAEMDMDGLA